MLDSESGVRSEMIDVAKARKYILERMALEPEAEEFQSELRR